MEGTVGGEEKERERVGVEFIYNKKYILFLHFPSQHGKLFR